MSSSSQAQTTEPRGAALAVLNAAAAEDLKQLWNQWDPKPTYQLVRGPETGLVMVRGRTGGGGAPFNLGEATVTRASVRLASDEIGHAYCLGRDGQKAEIIAVFDALWQRDGAMIETLVLAPLRAAALAADEKRRQETAATKVDFFTMVRGED